MKKQSMASVMFLKASAATNESEDVGAAVVECVKRRRGRSDCRKASIENIFEAASSSLTAVVVYPSFPLNGFIGSNLFFGTSLTPYQLNGNTGITKVTTGPA